MVISIRKGKILTQVQCSNGFWTNNLYCQDIRIIENPISKTLVLSLQFLKQSFNGDDFRDFVENIDWLITIGIRDDYTIKELATFLKYGERQSFKKEIEIIAGEVHHTFDISLQKNGTSNLIIKRIL